jgi:hypothetical protein
VGRPVLSSAASTSTPASFPIRAITFPTLGIRSLMINLATEFHLKRLWIEHPARPILLGRLQQECFKPRQQGMFSSVSFFCIAAGISRIGCCPSFQTGRIAPGLSQATCINSSSRRVEAQSPQRTYFQESATA